MCRPQLLAIQKGLNKGCDGIIKCHGDTAEASNDRSFGIKVLFFFHPSKAEWRDVGTTVPIGPMSVIFSFCTPLTYTDLAVE